MIRGKKQGGSQQVFVKFSLSLKGQKGPFFAKTRKKGKTKPIWRSYKVFPSLAVPESSPSADIIPLALVSVPERGGLDHQGKTGPSSRDNISHYHGLEKSCSFSISREGREAVIKTYLGSLGVK